MTSIYTADPSAHLFDGRIYIYASHDISEGPSLPDVEPFKGSKGNAFIKMVNYHVLSMDQIGGEVTVHPVTCISRMCPGQQGRCGHRMRHSKTGSTISISRRKRVMVLSALVWRLRKALLGRSTRPAEPIQGSYSIDPAVFTDEDGKSYMYFGGLWAGSCR